MTSVVVSDGGGNIVEYVTVVEEHQQVSLCFPKLFAGESAKPFQLKKITGDDTRGCADPTEPLFDRIKKCSYKANSKSMLHIWTIKGSQNSVQIRLP